MVSLLDVNVLIALAWPRHVHHASAAAWFTDAHFDGWATTPITESGFIRISSNPRVFPDGVSPGQAAALVARMRDVPGYEFWSDTVNFADAIELIEEHVHGSAFVTDAHLALLAKSYGGMLVTFDSQAASLATALGADVKLIGGES